VEKTFLRPIDFKGKEVEEKGKWKSGELSEEMGGGQFYMYDFVKTDWAKASNGGGMKGREPGTQGQAGGLIKTR